MAGCVGHHWIRFVTAGICGETGGRETGHGPRGTWTVDHGPRHLRAGVTLTIV